METSENYCIEDLEYNELLSELAFENSSGLDDRQTPELIDIGVEPNLCITKRLARAAKIFSDDVIEIFPDDKLIRQMKIRRRLRREKRHERTRKCRELVKTLNNASITLWKEIKRGNTISHRQCMDSSSLNTIKIQDDMTDHSTDELSNKESTCPISYTKQIMISRMIIYLLHLPLFLHLTFGEYPLTCPSKPHWNFRAKIVCNNTENYRCLWDANYHYFLEQCEGYDIQRKGFRKVIEGDITAGDCTPNTYQPRMWTTKGNFDCEFQKSLCNDEGQTIYEDGGGITDKTCGCNHTAGYGFLKKPKNLCYCVPSEEDCTCIKQKCRLHQKVDPEYKCRSIFRWKSWFSCPIKPCESLKKNYMYQENRHDTTKDLPDLKKVSEKRISYKMKAFVVVAVGLVLIIITGSFGIYLYTEQKGAAKQMQKNDILMEGNKDMAGLITLYDDINDHIPIKIRDRHKMQIENWEKDEKIFFVTRATTQVANLIERNNIVVVTGCSGSGKSSLIHHVALKLKTQGYDLIPYVSSPNDIIQYRDNKRDQLFVIEDPCGKKFIDKIDLNIWKKQSDKIKNLFPSKNSIQGRLKILVSCRLNIFEDDNFKSLSLFNKEAVDLQSEDYRLRADEKLAMLRMYISIADDDWQKINGKMKYCPFFPLQCKMSKGKTVDQLENLFLYPINCMRMDIRNVIKSKPMENCALVLYVLFPDTFHEYFIDYRKTPEKANKKITDITGSFKINLKNETEQAQLRNALTRLDGTYLKKTGSMYSISHDKLYDIVAVECWNGVADLYLKYAPSTLLAEKYRFASVFPEKEDQLCIYVKESDNENLYLKRIFEDLHEKSYKPFFNNQQLKEKMFRDKVMNYIHCNKESCVDLFGSLDINGMTELRTKDDFYKGLYGETYTTTPVIEATKAGFYRLVDYLLKIECDPHKKDSFANSPLWYSLEYGFEKIFGLFVQQGVDYYDELIAACSYGMSGAVEMMVNRELNVSKRDRDGDTPLTVACRSGHLVVVGLLLQNEADLFQCDKLEWTPLMWACRRGHHEIVAMLIRKSAAVVSHADRDGITPLILACDGGYIEVVKILLDNKANVLQRDSMDKTALDYTSDETIKKLLIGGCQRN